MEKLKEIDSTTSQCANCGAQLLYDPKTNGLRCGSCNSTFEFVHTRNNLDCPYLEASSENNLKWSQENRLVHCKSCGANVIITGYNVTAICPYCGSNYVSEVEELPGIKPNSVLPFAYDNKQAVQVFTKGVRKKFFVPRVFKKNVPEGNIYGLYVPTFSFDADTYSKYDGIITKRVYAKDSKGRDVVVVKRIPISGTFSRGFDDLLVEASSQIDSKILNSLLPYQLTQAYDFDTNYLRGYSVEHYDRSLDDSHKIAKEQMEKIIKADILRKYEYDEVVSFRMSTQYSNEKYAYSLIPIYTIAFEFKNKKYIAYMNGQTGKVGKGLPISPLKCFFVGLLVFIGILLVVLLIILGSE